MLALFNELYSHATPDCPNLVEINVTGGSRYFFTREPEHVKTVLTSKFADYGKGPEFHRVWVSCGCHSRAQVYCRIGFN